MPITKTEGAGLIFAILGFGIVYFAASAFVLAFCYGIVVLVFRHAFGVELPHPF